MAGAIAAAIGIVVAIEPDLWLGLFTRDPGALASGRTYLSIVGPVYGFFGLAMALYFACAGHRRDGVAGGRQPLPHPHRGVRQPAGARRAGLGRARPVHLRGASGIVCFSAVLAFSTTRPAWRRRARDHMIAVEGQTRR